MLHSNFFALTALVGLAVGLTSCTEKEELPAVDTKSLVTLDLRAFGLEDAPFTKATGEQPPQRIVFKAISADTTAYEASQKTGDAGYGTLNFELSPGTYKFVAVAHDMSKNATAQTPSASIDSATKVTMPEELVQDAFSLVKDVTIKPGVAFSEAMNLPRVISNFEIYMNDQLPAKVKNFKIVANVAGAQESGCAVFDPSTGFAKANRQWVKEVDISASAGRKDTHIGINLFLTAASQTMDITCTAFDTDGKEIIKHELKNVEMKQNRKTIARGIFFSAGGSASFTFSTNWDNSSEVEY